MGRSKSKGLVGDFIDIWVGDDDVEIVCGLTNPNYLHCLRGICPWWNLADVIKRFHKSLKTREVRNIEKIPNIK